MAREQDEARRVSGHSEGNAACTSIMGGSGLQGQLPIPNWVLSDTPWQKQVRDRIIRFDLALTRLDFFQLSDDALEPLDLFRLGRSQIFFPLFALPLSVRLAGLAS